MNTSFRRYELLIPFKLNDGNPVPKGAISTTLRELRKRFGAVSAETQIIRGQWEFEGHVYRDEHFRIFVDVEDTPENRQFFVNLKGTLKARFKQIDLWLTSHPIDVI
jgi:hypothetical protein